MDPVDVLVLHGSPGSGKTTMARAVAELLRVTDRPYGVIDLDDLSLVHPDQGRSFARTNLRAVWPSYRAIPGLRMIIPAVLADAAERDDLRAALPGARLVVCELTAPLAVLRARVTAREPNPYWQRRVQDFVALYARRTDLASLRDFQVETHDRSVADAAAEVVEKAGWG